MNSGQGPKATQKLKVHGCVFGLTKKDAEASNAIVTSIIPLFECDIRVLIDPGSKHSFIFARLVNSINIALVPLNYDLVISTPLGKTMLAESVCIGCVIRLCGINMTTDHILLEISNFDVILGMDWLTTHHAKVDCFTKEVTFDIPNQPKVVFKGTRSFPKLIFALRAKKIMQKGGLGVSCLCHLDQENEVRSRE